jgi:hypothetical protein
MKRVKSFKEINYIDFKVDDEDWNIYKLEDKTILKLKFVLLKVIREGIEPDGSPIYSMQAQILIAIFPPSDLIKSPDLRKYSVKELEEAVIKSDMKFDAKKEDYSSRYILLEQVGHLKIEVKPILVYVARTSKHDERGEPIYLIRTQAVTKQSPYPLPKRMKEEFLKLLREQ